MNYLELSNDKKNTVVRHLCRVTGCATRKVRVASTALDIRTRDVYITVGQERVAQPSDGRCTYRMERARTTILGRKRVLLRLKRVNQ